MPRNSPIIPLFMHIPKTAGTTLHYALRRQYRKNLQTVYLKNELENPSLKRNTKALIGHFRFPFVSHLPKRNYGLITYFRNPINQVFSNYNYIKSNATGNHGAFAEYTLEQFLEHPLGNNLFTRSLCGYKFIGEDEEALRIAKENLDSFLFVGISEEFDAGLLALQKLLKWRKKPYYVRATVQKYSDKITQEDKALIEKYSKLDLELYAYGQAIWEKKKAELNIDFKMAQKFKMKNHWYGMLAKKWHRLKNLPPE